MWHSLRLIVINLTRYKTSLNLSFLHDILNENTAFYLEMNVFGLGIHYSWCSVNMSPFPLLK